MGAVVLFLQIYSTCHNSCGVCFADVQDYNIIIIIVHNILCGALVRTLLCKHFFFALYE